LKEAKGGREGRFSIYIPILTSSSRNFWTEVDCFFNPASLGSLTKVCFRLIIYLQDHVSILFHVYIYKYTGS
jgi:hypothetical protein